MGVNIRSKRFKNIRRRVLKCCAKNPASLACVVETRFSFLTASAFDQSYI